MSHEIRTPLNGVVGSLELALQTDLTPEQAGYLRVTHQAASGLTLLLNDILDFSKIDAGMLTLKPVAFCLDECLAPVLKPVAFKAHAKGLELVVDIAPDLPTHFEGSPERIGQVITNLINNAIKFTNDGSITLRVSMGGSEVSKRVCFEVEDTGIGIAKANHAAVFDAFRQAEASTAREYGGTGLGLAICKQLVTLMQGTIHLESELGRGTCIRFELPLAPLPSPDRASRDQACLAGKSVLILGSHPAQLAPLQATLEMWNMVVHRRMFPSGDLWSIAGEPGHFDVVLLDVDGPLGDHQGVAETLASGYPNAEWLLLLRTNATLMLDTASIPARRLAKPALASELLAVLVSSLGSSAPSVDTSVARWPVADTALTVLVADDNAANRAVALGILRKIGHNAVAVCDGQEAVEAMERQAFDILLMDLQMPKMDGVEATRRIREREREAGGESRLPIVALTAQDFRGEEASLLEGMDGKLSKPMHHRELIAILERVTHARHRVISR